jgi:hypothetical protein
MTAMRFGVALPPMIVPLYTRDSSGSTRCPIVSIPMRVSRRKGDVVTIAGFEVDRPTDQFKAVGTGS